jgi:hypothetical protein
MSRHSEYYHPTGADKRRLGRFIRQVLRWYTPNGEIKTHAEKLWAADIYRMLRSGQTVTFEFYDCKVRMTPDLVGIR